MLIPFLYLAVEDMSGNFHRYLFSKLTAKYLIILNSDIKISLILNNLFIINIDTVIKIKLYSH